MRASVFAWATVGILWTTAAIGAELGHIDDFALDDVDGRRHTAQEWQDRRVVVYCVLGTECPVSNGYAPQMQRLAEKYAPRGVEFVGVYCEPTVTVDEARKHGAEYGLKFTRLLDPTHALVRQTGASRMPTFVVVAGRRDDVKNSDAVDQVRAGAIIYRGRIDDRWSPEGRRRDVPRTHELEDAIEAFLAGRAPTIAETPTFGCPLPRARAGETK